MKFKKYVIVLALSMTVAAASILLTSSASVAENPHVDSSPVTIASPLPLPVTGNIEISNSGSNPVLVRDVGESAKEPFQAGIVATGFSNGGGSSALVTVPAHKRLVIEHISANINVSGASGLLSANIFSGLGSQLDEIACMPQGSNALNHWSACSVQTRYFAEAGQTVTFSAFAVDSNSTGFYRAFISGYYVPVP